LKRQNSRSSNNKGGACIRNAFLQSSPLSAFNSTGVFVSSLLPDEAKIETEQEEFQGYRRAEFGRRRSPVPSQRSGTPGKSDEQVRSGLNCRSGVMHLQSQQMKANEHLGGLRNQSLTHLFRLLPSNHPVSAPLDDLKLHGDLRCFQVRRVQRFDPFRLERARFSRRGRRCGGDRRGVPFDAPSRVRAYKYKPLQPHHRRLQS